MTVLKSLVADLKIMNTVKLNSKYHTAVCFGLIYILFTHIASELWMNFSFFSKTSMPPLVDPAPMRSWSMKSRPLPQPTTPPR
jgi:hypothetical protein